jgi:peroxiredoxin
MIAVGDRLPTAGSLMYFDPDAGPGAFDLAARLAGRCVVLVGVPGAFTPTCSERHLPGFIVLADKLQAAGVDEIICLSVNDPHVMRAWSKSMNGEALTFVADWDASFVRALGLEVNRHAQGMGWRSSRFAMLLRDGVVSHIGVEEQTKDLDVSSAEAILQVVQG